MLANFALLTVCVVGVFVGTLLGVFAMSLLQMARSTEETHERRFGSVVVGTGDGNDAGPADSRER